MCQTPNVEVYLDTQIKDEAHIVRANLPVSIDNNGDNWKIDWKDAGLQQIKIYAPKGLELVNQDWKVEQEGDYYVLTRYGDKGELEIAVN